MEETKLQLDAAENEKFKRNIFRSHVKGTKKKLLRNPKSLVTEKDIKGLKNRLSKSESLMKKAKEENIFSHPSMLSPETAGYITVVQVVDDIDKKLTTYYTDDYFTCVSKIPYKIKAEAMVMLQILGRYCDPVVMSTSMSDLLYEGFIKVVKVSVTPERKRSKFHESLRALQDASLIYISGDKIYMNTSFFFKGDREEYLSFLRLNEIRHGNAKEKLALSSPI